MTVMTRTNHKALSAFTARKAEIDTMLARLQSLSDEHFNANPDEIDWGDVGDPADIATKLSEITRATNWLCHTARGAMADVLKKTPRAEYYLREGCRKRPRL